MRRATDYVEMMKRCWSEQKSFDYESKYAKAEGVPPADEAP